MLSCKLPILSEINSLISKKKRFICRFLLILNWLVLISIGSAGQEVPYPEIFGANWTKALRFVEENKEWMRKECKLCRVDYSLAVSVVFPELVRYSALRDKIEITLLKALYTHKGSEYSDFSVGVFQIKPSCAEKIIGEILHTEDRKLSGYFSKLHRSLSDTEKRMSILKELEDPESEFIYVMGMIRLLDKKYGNVTWSDGQEKVSFYAAAFNAGFYNSEAWIRQQMTAETFHTGIVKPPECYSYARISAAFSREIKDISGN
jgi:hypothetical protein